MRKQSFNLVIAGFLGLLIVAIGLSFLFGFNNPVSWVLIVVAVLIPVLYRVFSKGEELQWKDDYSVGINSLDEDHKKLIDLLNQFRIAYLYQTSREFEREALNQLVNYTKFHFQKEEKLMEEAGYPQLEAHKAQHRSMIEQVDIFLKDYEQQGHEALHGVAAYLEGWLINHINGTDKQYSSCLKEKGIN